jgi:hypothetical protein
MKIPHLYEDVTGASHFGETDIDVQEFTREGGHTVRISETLPAAGVRFMGAGAGASMAPHPAPQRQLMIVVQGQWECIASDGSSRLFGPGGYVLMEDVSGVGHTTRNLPGDPVLTVAVGLA